MNEQIVHIDHLNYSYTEEKALTDITLDIERGDFLGIIGPNGSGKTTLLKLILGLLTPSEGTISLFGTPLSKFRDWKRVGYVPQKAGLNTLSTKFPITVEEIVGMGLVDTPFTSFFSHRHSSVAAALKAVEMEHYRKRLLNELSGGQQQRVFIARALVSKPELLVLDEPTVGVDQDVQGQFYDLLKRLNTEHHLTLILVSHDIDIIAHEVKTIAFINKKLMYHGTPKEVINGDTMDSIYGKRVKFLVHTH